MSSVLRTPLQRSLTVVRALEVLGVIPLSHLRLWNECLLSGHARRSWCGDVVWREPGLPVGKGGVCHVSPGDCRNEGVWLRDRSRER